MPRSTLSPQQILQEAYDEASGALRVSGLSGTYQPLDSDLTAIAALSTTSYGRSLLTLANQAAMDALLNGTYAAVAESFEVMYGQAPFANTNFSTLGLNGSSHYNGYVASSGAQNDAITYKVPELKSGTWSIRLLHYTDAGRGIYTIAASPDGSAWTALGTVDGYSSPGVGAVSSDVTGVTMPANTKYIRLTMATKNASASNYTGVLSGISGVRTGA